jgi:hypothetical protein
VTGHADAAAVGGRGAYGLRVAGLDGAEDMLLAADPTWPLLTVRWIETAAAAAPPSVEPAASTVTFHDGSALVDHGAAGTIDVQRDPAVATFRIRSTRDPRALVHPYLGGAASIVSRWLGREAFHGGGFLHESAAWVVLGGRTAGKSSLLAWLHSQGLEILADDLVVVDEGIAYAGPRSLDLRRESADALAVGEPLGQVGARERWRISLDPTALAVPVAGFVFLRWDQRSAVTGVSGSARLTRLMQALVLPDRPASADAMLGLAALPCLELGRRRDWKTVAESGAALLAALG